MRSFLLCCILLLLCWFLSRGLEQSDSCYFSLIFDGCSLHFSGLCLGNSGYFSIRGWFLCVSGVELLFKVDDFDGNGFVFGIGGGFMALGFAVGEHSYPSFNGFIEHIMLELLILISHISMFLNIPKIKLFLFLLLPQLLLRVKSFMKCISSGINNRLNLIFLHRQFFVILKMQSIRILSCRRFWLFVELHGIRVMYIYRVGLVDHLINKQSLFM